MAWADSFDAITTKAHPGCDDSSFCRVIESNGTFEVTMAPQVKHSLKVLKKLTIRNLKTGGVQDFALAEMNGLEGDAFFELYKIGFRPGIKDTDLVLHAYNSAREGPSYYYFLYDSSKQSFVMSDGTFPRLVYDSKSKTYRTAYHHIPYVLGKDLKLNPENSK
jgi:hypothetical protein